MENEIIITNDGSHSVFNPIINESYHSKNGAIIEAMHIAFSENRGFTTEDIANSIQQFIPLAELNSEKIDELQEWADAGRIRLAS